MRRCFVMTVLLTLAVAMTGSAAPVQVTDSLGDSTLQRFGPVNVGFGALLSTGDLTPGEPGNADGSQEVFLLNFRLMNVRQVTSSAGDASSANISSREMMVMASREDLTPGEPGNTDRSFESYLYDKKKETLTQLSSSSEDTFFQTFYDDGAGALFVSKGDLTPGDPGNPDGENEVFDYDFDTGTWRQLTSSPQESLVRGIDPKSRYAVIQSRGDLTPGAPGNADHNPELFMLDIETRDVVQLTDSPGETFLGTVSRKGRYIAINSNGDLTPGAPGNTDGGYEAYLYDTKTGELRQVTDSPGDSWFVSFDRKARRMALQSDSSLDPDGPGNADGSFEVFVYHIGRRTTTQITDSDEDAWFMGYEPRKGKWIALESSGDLAATGPGNADGSTEVFFARLKKNPAKNRFYQATDGDEDVEFGGWCPKKRFAACETTADLVPGGNLDGSSEVYVLRSRRKPYVVQLTASAEDSFVGAFSPDGEWLFIESHGDLDPSGPGNADHSREIYYDRYK